QVDNITFTVEKLLAAQGALQCHDSEMLQANLIELYHHPQKRAQLIANAKQVVAQNQGATQRIYHLLNLDSLT
ncbi:MAG TPA: hypothetical protein DF614_02735, partial [Methylococcaceae bacterium]|nr:hypothetical protein [Methylococcaceae bacterium]